MLSSSTSLAAVAAALLPVAAAAVKPGPIGPATTYALCQQKTTPALTGCPAGTIFVSQNDTSADFTSIQTAILSLPNDTSWHIILIAAGSYEEQLNVTRAGPLTLLGQSDMPLKGELLADINVNTSASNDVTVIWKAANGNSRFTDNVYTGVLTVGPTLNATLTGSGPWGFPVPADTPFGSSDFRAYNIDFRNTWAEASDGPSHALGVSRANAGFYSCGFYSWQDTIYIGKLGNAYFYDTITAGQTDFLYGFGTLYIEKSTLSLRMCGGGITAWKGALTDFPNKYGVYIANSQVIAYNYTTQLKVVNKCALGRPWNALHSSVFMDTYFDSSVLDRGYIPWGSAAGGNVNASTFMATWDDYGPGYNETAERASNLTIVLDNAGAKPYRYPVDVFITPDGTTGNIGWIDPTALYGPRKQCK